MDPVDTCATDSKAGDLLLTDTSWFREDPFINGNLPLAEEPTTAKPIGNPEAARLGIYLSQEAAHFIDAFIQANPNRAMGGILVGYVAESTQRPFILITGAVEAKEPVDAKNGIRFLSSTWQYMEEIWHREYPDTLVLGWFHSNPGQGTALTQYDQFTHYRLFDRTWQVSFTVDALHADSCFHYWDDGQLVPLDSFYLWNPSQSVRLINTLVKSSIGAQIALDTSSLAARRMERQRPLLVQLSRSYVWLILLLFFGLIGAFPWVARHLPGVNTTLAESQARLQLITENLERATEAHALLQQRAPTAEKEQPSVAPPAYEVVAPIVENKPSLPSGLGTPNDAPSQTLVGYTVEPGDTLWEISGRILGDPHAYKRLADMNAILNPDIIYPGMSLQVKLDQGDAQTTGSESINPERGSGQ